MIDLRKDFHIAINNISRWKNATERKSYVHRKLLANIMFRTISTKNVFEAFLNGDLVSSESIEESMHYVEHLYNSMAEEIQPMLMDMLRRMDNEEMIGTVSFYFYKRLAYEAEVKDESMDDLEFIYVFEQLNDACVLFYVAYLLAGYSRTEALAKITGSRPSSLPNDTLGDLKEFFQPHIAEYMNENYQRPNF